MVHLFRTAIANNAFARTGPPALLPLRLSGHFWPVSLISPVAMRMTVTGAADNICWALFSVRTSEHKQAFLRTIFTFKMGINKRRYSAQLSSIVNHKMLSGNSYNKFQTVG